MVSTLVGPVVAILQYISIVLTSQQFVIRLIGTNCTHTTITATRSQLFQSLHCICIRFGEYSRSNNSQMHYGKFDAYLNWPIATRVYYKSHALHIVIVCCSVRFEILSTPKMGCDILIENILKGIVVSHAKNGIRLHQIQGTN